MSEHGERYTGAWEHQQRCSRGGHAAAVFTEAMTERIAAPAERSGRPVPGEYADYAQADIDNVNGDDAVAVLETLTEETLAFLRGLPEEKLAGVRYAPGKWTVKDLVAHLTDDERIFAYRALCVARGETQPLAGFDEKLYAACAAGEERPWLDLLAEYTIVRAATLALLRALPAVAWTRRGTVNGYSATARGLAFHIAGHELHHLRIVRERYLPLLA
jgi:uncharacterized damage-inducible protein DinB